MGEVVVGDLIGGRYRLLELLGAGGMGRVWKAHDEQLGVDVAVKEVFRRADVPDGHWQELLARGKREARHGARLRDHPHIVAVFDIVVDNGTPWTVMRLVNGVSLETRLNSGPLSSEQAEKVAAGVLSALGAAHDAGILHRDVKPANIMLTHDGGVLLADFGIAVNDEDTKLTREGSVIGSMAYIAPERADGAHGGPASDLFSLGVTLYQAVEGGGSPFQRDTLTATLRAVALHEPPPPARAGRLEPLIRGLMAKDPAMRPTVDQALALGRFPPPESGTGRARPAPGLLGEPPISPGPGGASTLDQDHGVRFPAAGTADQPSGSPHGARRLSRRGLLAGTAALVGGGTAAAWALTRSEKTVHSSTKAAAGTGGSATGSTGPTEPPALSPSTFLSPTTTPPPTPAASQAAARPVVLVGHNGKITSVRFSPDGHTLASASEDQTVLLWKTTDPEHPPLDPIGGPLTGHTDSVNAVAFSPDGRTLATASSDKTIRLWNVANATHAVPIGRPLTGHSGIVVSVAFSPDGRTLASGSWDTTVRLWNVVDAAHPAPVSKPVSDADIIDAVAFCPGGRILASVNRASSNVRLWNVEDPSRPAPIGQPIDDHTDVSSIAFSPDGRTLACTGDNALRLWDISDPAHPVLIGRTAATADQVYAATFSSAGNILATASPNWPIQLWNVADPAHPAPAGQAADAWDITSLALSPDRHGLAAASGKSVFVWYIA